MKAKRGDAKGRRKGERGEGEEVGGERRKKKGKERRRINNNEKKRISKGPSDSNTSTGPYEAV